MLRYEANDTMLVSAQANEYSGELSSLFFVLQHIYRSFIPSFAINSTCSTRFKRIFSTTLSMSVVWYCRPSEQGPLSLRFPQTYTLFTYMFFALPSMCLVNFVEWNPTPRHFLMDSFPFNPISSSSLRASALQAVALAKFLFRGLLRDMFPAAPPARPVVPFSFGIIWKLLLNVTVCNRLLFDKQKSNLFLIWFHALYSRRKPLHFKCIVRQPPSRPKKVHFVPLFHYCPFFEF